MPYHCVRANLAFSHQEVDFDGRANRARRLRFQEHASKTEVSHARNVVASIALPAYPDFLL